MKTFALNSLLVLATVVVTLVAFPPEGRPSTPSVRNVLVGSTGAVSARRALHGVFFWVAAFALSQGNSAKLIYFDF